MTKPGNGGFERPIDLPEQLEEHSEVALGAISSLVGTRETSTSAERLDTVEEIFVLEQRAQATKFIARTYALSELDPLERALAALNRPMHAVTHIGNQFATKIMPCFMNPDPDSGWEAFSSIPPHTTDEELTLLIDREQFDGMHKSLGEYLDEHEEEYHQSAEERLAPRTSPENPDQGIIPWNDRYQFNGNETQRSLENMTERGVRISIDPNGLEDVKAAYTMADGGILPVTEIVKNKEVLGVNGFMSSKIALAVHDSIDHTMGFQIAERTGLLSKYANMFESIGNPQHTDIFKREGEALASIGFGVRYWANLEHGFVPLVTAADLLARMDRMFDRGKLTDRHMEAFKILRGLGHNDNSREAQSLGFVFSNYIVELDEQRRKHGKIKQKDLVTKKVEGELDPFSADYLSFFVEMHHQLLSSHNKHRDNLLRYHILLEEYLCAVGSGQLSPDQELVIRVQDMKDIDFSQTKLPPSRIQWMTRNYGFSAIRDAIL